MERETRCIPWLGVLLALAAAVAAAEEPASTGTVDLQRPARIRLFGQNDRKLWMRTNALKPPEQGQFIRLEGAGGGLARTFFGKNETQSIGIPETTAVRTMRDGKMPMAKPYYREFALTPGQQIHLYGNYQGAFRCVPASDVHKTELARKIAPPPNLTLTPEPGIDYEVQLATDCTLQIRQVLADGRAVPVPKERQRLASPAGAQAEGSHLFVFLFAPGSVLYRLVGEPADLELQNDRASEADAFEARIQKIAQTPGAQLCVVAPAFDYRSPLYDRLDAVLKRQGEATPSIFEQSAALRSTMKIEAGQPTTFAAAASYCQLATAVAWLTTPAAPPKPPVQ